MNQITACPLDCYDACRIVVETSGRFRGDKNHPVTNGYLCPHLNHYSKTQRLLTPSFRGGEISMDEALGMLADFLQKSPETLYYRGSGNIGLMQRSVEHFFAAMDATGTKGSLCDGAGEAGVLLGRGENWVLSPSMLTEAEVIVVWGRNLHVTHSHLVPILSGKKIIVIDPIKTALAQQADLHLQIKPHCDVHLALLLSRFAMIEGMHDVDFLEEFGTGYNDFYELTQTVRIKATLDMIDLSLGDIGAVLEIVRGKRTAILVGAGVQKYRNGADVLRSIDAFGALLGLFGKRGSGVSYLGDSLKGIELPFRSISKRVAKPAVDFSRYGCVFIQGGNPLAQMPDSSKVEREFAQAGYRVYFGLHDNETARSADLVIPAKSFDEKSDVRSSYGDYTMQPMRQIHQSEIGISEYDLAAFLSNHFGLMIPSEEEALALLASQIETVEGVGYRRSRPAVPYEKGFATDSGEFEFMDEIDLSMDQSEGFFLITAKFSGSLNSQFRRPSGVYFHPDCGFSQGERVVLQSPNGSVVMEVKYDERLRRDCLLIYSGTVGVNHLTPSQLSDEGMSAVYQETKIKVEKC
ncbi:MAG: molybdopterin-dependent oxidoreductase [Sulfuricurvum sp.]|jgi:anaerobic selenocysteine-containing dehydrogenase|uniref:molybdopterin-dependent oxidoreductase n=1 Tax=Sulfuricurvum sp. TaxID=2025608 RepID=UPI0025FF8A64|nr:molybdopterin-dependent oxidoreductase [Sulfuricurvum sp.]MCK9373242.1 molybdopterin-dependent oxidoreductase [Sulfuricurvum sp.]